MNPRVTYSQLEERIIRVKIGEWVDLAPAENLMLRAILVEPNEPWKLASDHERWISSPEREFGELSVVSGADESVHPVGDIATLMDAHWARLNAEKTLGLTADLLSVIQDYVRAKTEAGTLTPKDVSAFAGSVFAVGCELAAQMARAAGQSLPIQIQGSRFKFIQHAPKLIEGAGGLDLGYPDPEPIHPAQTVVAFCLTSTPCDALGNWPRSAERSLGLEGGAQVEQT